MILIEDSAAIRETLVHALESTGSLAIVGVAETASDARLLIENTAADAVIIDLQLRASTGFEVLADLRALNGKAKPIQIVLTNYAAPIFRQRCKEYGADYFFDKSLEFDRVIET